ncbi:E3 ubiquitin ligase component cereblon isoform 1-T2 [Glossina fuscipes fuscipes]
MSAEQDEDVNHELNSQKTEVDNNIASSSVLVTKIQNSGKSNGKQIRSCGTKIGVNIDQALGEMVSAIEQEDETTVRRNNGKAKKAINESDNINDKQMSLVMNLEANVLSSTTMNETTDQCCGVCSEIPVEGKSEYVANGNIDANLSPLGEENIVLKTVANPNLPVVLVNRLSSSALNELLTCDDNALNNGDAASKDEASMEGNIVSNMSQEEDIPFVEAVLETSPQASIIPNCSTEIRRLSSELNQDLIAEEAGITDNSVNGNPDSLVTHERNNGRSPFTLERRSSTTDLDNVEQNQESSSEPSTDSNLSGGENRNSSEGIANHVLNDIVSAAMDESNNLETRMNTSLPVVLVRRLSPSAINEILNRDSNNTYELDNGDDVSMVESDNESFDVGRLLAEESFDLSRMFDGTDSDTDTVLSSLVGQVVPRERPPSSEIDPDIDRYRDEEMYQNINVNVRNQNEEESTIHEANDGAAAISEEDREEEEMAVGDEAESSFAFPNITSSEDNDDENIEDESSHDEDGWSINADVSVSARPINYDATFRQLIDQTRRSIAYAAASIQPSSNGPSELVRRDSFMQRFRRVLFILSSRQRRLIRLGLASPDVENPEGEAGAEELNDGPNNAALERIVQNLGLDLDHLNDIEQLTASAAMSSQQRQEEIPENAVRFDTNLPAEHSYMGSNMNRVSGVNYLEVDQHYNMTLFMHQHILFPGEILPFMISGSIIDGDIDTQNGFLFGVCFPVLELRAENLYGVTCQIYEKGTDERGNTLIKSRALQRFAIKTDDLFGPLEYINDHPMMKCYGNVKILPDIYLPEPLKCINMGSMSRFRDNASMKSLYKRYQIASAPWPAHIYDQYSIASIIEKARTQLAAHKIHTMPTDPTQLSYWLVRNLHLSENLMHSIFLTNSVNTRLRMIANTFKEEYIFSCRYCSSHIANCRELFAMSKHGVQTQYCNSAGYVHETNTLYQVNNQAILYSGAPSAEFSWFPGYQWHSIVCKVCKHHLGWEFKAVEPNLVPKQFFGISSSSVRVRPTQSGRNESRIRSIMRLNTMPMIGGDNDRDASAGGGDTE